MAQNETLSGLFRSAFSHLFCSKWNAFEVYYFLEHFFSPARVECVCLWILPNPLDDQCRAEPLKPGLILSLSPLDLYLALSFLSLFSGSGGVILNLGCKLGRPWVGVGEVRALKSPQCQAPSQNNSLRVSEGRTRHQQRLKLPIVQAKLTLIGI